MSDMFIYWVSGFLAGAFITMIFMKRWFNRLLDQLETQPNKKEV